MGLKQKTKTSKKKSEETLSVSYYQCISVGSLIVTTQKILIIGETVQRSIWYSSEFFVNLKLFENQSLL